MLSKVNTKIIKNCYDISKIKAEINRVNENKEAKIRRIEDTINEYNIKVCRMVDCENKRIMQNKLHELGVKINNMRKAESLKQREEAFKKQNNIKSLC